MWLPLLRRGQHAMHLAPPPVVANRVHVALTSAPFRTSNAAPPRSGSASCLTLRYTFVVCKWRVWMVAVFQVAAFSVVAAAPKEVPVATARITPELRASLTRDYQIEVLVQPHEGDAWSRLSRRVTGDANKWEELAALNGKADESLQSEKPVRVPLALLRPGLQRQIVEALFAQDRLTAEGWRHVVIGARGVEGESLWTIAEWFTGDGANYTAIRKANPNQDLSTRRGDTILVPLELLSPAFGGGRRTVAAPSQTAAVAAPDAAVPSSQSAVVPTPRAGSEEVPPEVAEAVAVATAEPPALTYERDAAEPYAVYRLQKGEALYSSVAIRFTGRVYSKDVGDVLDRIVKLNEIEDVARMKVGYRVKIPMDLLLPEYLPKDDPARIARENAKRESTIIARRARAHGLSGVHVILDPGHGGGDPGTTHDDVWESSYVYDVAVRLKAILEKKSGAKVSLTTRSKDVGYQVVEKDALENLRDHYVQTTPRYRLEDPVVGVNLRWYLANSIFARAMKGGVPREKVLFLSIHADSLHPSLRGAMAYIPGERFVTGSFQKSDDVYLARAEVRERPIVKHSRDESLAAEGLSRAFAESVLGAFAKSGLKVHPFNPVRDNVVRGEREWVPAVIRHNLVPTRMLLEVCNLGNRKDRELIKTQKYRQQLAEAISTGIADFFDARGQEQEKSRSVVTRASATK